MIGRNSELNVLRECVDSDRSRLVVVYGRRRVGKTFLIREAFDYRFTFTHTGIEDGTYEEQLAGFWRSIKNQLDGDCRRPENWADAFDLLGRALTKSADSRKTVFIDELPWMDTRNSGFVKAVSTFWNGWASARKDIVMVVCGSASAWITKKILNSRGGLFNRANRTLFLRPFTLCECEKYLESEGIEMDRRDVLSAYMVFGGAPYYWSLLQKGESLSQGIDRLCFSPNAELAREFGRLYRSVFETPEPYVSIVTALTEKKIGLTRDQIIRSVPGLGSSGKLSEILSNLEICGFVRRYAIGEDVKKNAVYQLIDNYTLFYLQFIRDYAGRDEHHWLHLVRDPVRTIWEGLAFERVCLLHTAQIKQALGISGVATSEFAWRGRPSEGGVRGAQIDLVIQRADRVHNLCEMKFADSEYVLEKDEAASWRERAATYRRETDVHAACHVTLVTPYGIRHNRHDGVVQSVVTMDDLFRN